MSRFHLPLILVVGLLLIGGCEQRDEIRAQRAPKGPPPQMLSGGGVSAPTGQSVEVPEWTLPAGWTELPANEMRYATIQVSPDHPSVVMTVIPLGLESRALLPNVNRWQRELGLAESPESALATVSAHLHVGDLHVDVVDLTGPPATADKPQLRTLAAIVPRDERVWYFKLMGPADIVASQKSNFDAFIQSLRFTGSVQQPPTNGAPSAPTKLSWTTPPGWREETQPRPMRTVTFFMGPAEDQAELIVTRLSASGSGTFLDNVNRWRGMFGLEPVTDTSTVKMSDIPINDGLGKIVELSDAQNTRQMLVAIGATGQDLWFFRLTGPSTVVSDQRDEFESFLKSVRFGE